MFRAERKGNKDFSLLINFAVGRAWELGLKMEVGGVSSFEEVSVEVRNQIRRESKQNTGRGVRPAVADAQRPAGAGLPVLLTALRPFPREQG